MVRHGYRGAPLTQVYEKPHYGINLLRSLMEGKGIVRNCDRYTREAKL